MWWDKFLEWGFRREADLQFKEVEEELKIKDNRIKVDVMADDTDPNEVTIENAYKTRWIWYHTILAIGIFMTNVLLISILLLLAIKL
jgi:hypothetical protein